MEKLGKLTPEQMAVLREGATEPAFSGKLLHNMGDGTYRCAYCGSALFSSGAKFESGTGWPSFDSPISPRAVELRPDTSHGMARTEVLCGRCGSHIGHVFDDGPTETGKRFCMNSCAMDFEGSGKERETGSKASR